MTLRKKTIILISITLLSLFFLLYQTSRMIYLERFKVLEKTQMETNINRSINALNNRIDELDRITLDYAAWDDTYLFASGHVVSNYLESNYNDESITYNGINMVFLYDKNGKLLFKKGINLQTKKNLSHLTDIEAVFQKNKFLFQHQKPLDVKKGIMKVPGGTLLISSRPIVKSNKKGDLNGTLIMGKFLDNGIIDHIKETVQMDVNLLPYFSESLPIDYQNALTQLKKNKNKYVTLSTKNTISGFTIIKDVKQNPLLLLKVKKEREIMQQAKAGLLTFFISFWLYGLVILLFILGLIDRLVLRRILKLNGDINKMNNEGIFSDRFQTSGSDEIKELVDSMNHMLDIIENSEELIRQNEKRLRLITDNVQDIIIQIDNSGKILFINPAFEEILGYAFNKFFHLVHPEDSDRLRKVYMDLVNGIQMEAIEFRLKNIHEKYLWFEAIGETIMEDGKVISAIITCRHITERKQLMTNLIEAKNEAERANRTKSEFLSTMSHELRTPMNAILGFSQLLKYDSTEPLSPSQEESVDEILSAGNHLLNLINEILDLAKVEAGKVTLSLETIDFTDIIKESLSLINPLAIERNITVHFQPFEAHPLLLETDKMRLKQILLNLLSNGIKYNRSNGMLDILLEKVGLNKIRLTISDTGYGIPTDQLDKIFEPFHRLATPDSPIVGTGIGLTVTKELIELMGGQIGVESEVDKGSRFWIELKIADNKLELKQITEAEASSEPIELLTKQKTVLYIEDTPTNVILVERVLTQLKNIKMLSAEDGELGIDLAQAHQPDLILLDINLPGIDGFEVLKRLNRLEETKDIPVVAISANAMPQDIEKGLAAGFDFYITKPIHIPSFIEKVSRFLDERK